jgi:hypothetical protein
VIWRKIAKAADLARKQKKNAPYLTLSKDLIL